MTRRLSFPLRFGLMGLLVVPAVTVMQAISEPARDEHGYGPKHRRRDVGHPVGGPAMTSTRLLSCAALVALLAVPADAADLNAGWLDAIASDNRLPQLERIAADPVHVSRAYLLAVRLGTDQRISLRQRSELARYADACARLIAVGGRP